MRYRLIFLAGVLGITVPLAYGQTDPATLHIGPGSGTTCATGCAGEPNLISTTALDIYQNSNGSGDTITSGNLALIFAVPTGESAPSITGETDTNPYPGGTTTTGSVTLDRTASGFSSGELYTFLGFTGGDNSNSFTNISAAELAHLGLTVTSFTVYEYTINSTLGPNGLANVTGHFAPGSYAVGYGCSSPATLNTSTGCVGGNGGNIFSTPFTEGGLVVPEPTAIFLLGSSMIAVGAVVRRRRNRLTQN